MKYGLVLLVTFFSLPLLAKDKSMSVHVYGSESDRQRLEKQFPEADVTSSEQLNLNARSTVLPIEVQADFFQATGLDSFVAEFDQFDRDMLIRRLRFTTPEATHKHFPNIPVDRLRLAKQTLLKYN